MQINYPNESVRRVTAEFWYAPDLDNTLRAMDVPPIYAPYGTIGFWPNAVSSTPLQQTTPDTSIAPNSGKQNTVASAMMSLYGGAPPAASPAVAQATGQSMGPATLVAPMPSITPSPQAAVTPTPAPIPCNSVSTWVSQNPMLAALAVVGTYFFLGGHK